MPDPALQAIDLHFSGCVLAAAVVRRRVPARRAAQTRSSRQTRAARKLVDALDFGVLSREPGVGPVPVARFPR
jgi:hypothetical protein